MPKTSTRGVPQLLKWIGNKQRFAEEIVQYMPEKIDTYFEPFLGSGAVLAALSNSKYNSLAPDTLYKKAIASDVLEPLINIFEYVKKDPDILVQYYFDHISDYENNKKDNYLKIRERFNTTRNPLDFALLSRTCYSGIIRFRKSDGYMSTPVGPHKPISPLEFEKRVKLWNQLVQDTVFIHSDFKQIMSMAGEGDLVYCDPPYTHSQSIIYGAQTFDINKLFSEIASCKRRGAKVMLSINGKRRSGNEDIGVQVPEGLFEREVYVNCGISMINRLQRTGQIMINEDVHDKLLLTW
ncbi:Dam family site-specific DNA-(adenine-N6)-methyltransferase [Radiobacillus kanasensis]|uniref:DNA adenine methylase n=1 Tax=Radiobacillus kanasensis TaxID=2844358 RepID=UPI001E4E0965|nr:Dam family site-specific DNA-(adenine-N6)-methyltransferase [Radiobacillus kanasensis]UFU00173.1 Dam family site-specific DNA-(adenine-N6)-methyltransferase [Radiobacillus kanasensis]